MVGVALAGQLRTHLLLLLLMAQRREPQPLCLLLCPLAQEDCLLLQVVHTRHEPLLHLVLLPLHLVLQALQVRQQRVAAAPFCQQHLVLLRHALLRCCKQLFLRPQVVARCMQRHGLTVPLHGQLLLLPQ